MKRIIVFAVVVWLSAADVFNASGQSLTAAGVPTGGSGCWPGDERWFTGLLFL
jgi:hypothetical protein